MPLPSAPVRFAVEAVILLGVAVALSLADLGLGSFVLLMALTWLAVAAGERVAAGAASPPRRTLTEAESEALPVHADTAGAPAVPPRRSPFEALRETGPEDAAPEEAAPPLPAAAVPADPLAAELEMEPSAVEAPIRPPVEEPHEAPSRAEPSAAEVAVEPSSAGRETDSAEPRAEPVTTAVAESAPAESREDHETPPPRVATLGPRPDSQARWNLWELERLAREKAGSDPWREEEWAALLVHLREFADADGMLPPDFDGLVRESFGELIRS